MKRLLIIILFLFLFTGCKKEEDFILGISRIDDSKICEEYCIMELKIISSANLDNIYLDSINANSNYEYQVQKSNNQIRVEDNNLYAYDLIVKVFEPTSIEKIDLMINDKKYHFNIGIFNCLQKETINSNSLHLDFELETFQELNSDVVHHKIVVTNKTEKGIVLGDIKVQNENIQVCSNIQTNFINSQETTLVADCFVWKQEDLYKLGYVLEIYYAYNGKMFKTYFNITDDASKDINTSSTNTIIMDKSCFVFGK